MAETKKETVTFLVGSDDEEEKSTSTFQCPSTEPPSKESYSSKEANKGKENIRTPNLMDRREKEFKRRRRSDINILQNDIPARGATSSFTRDRHISDTDSSTRRFVLNPSSKVQLEVRRNHSVPPDNKFDITTPKKPFVQSQKNQIRVLNNSSFDKRLENNPKLTFSVGPPIDIGHGNSNGNERTNHIDPAIESPTNESVVGSLPRTLSTSVLRIKSRRSFWEKVVG